MKLVLDTNVVLDWLVFDDPSTRELQLSLLNGNASVISCALIADELRRVLAYSQLRLDDRRQAEVLARYSTQTIPVPIPEGFSRNSLQLPPAFPRCRDRDDELFLAVAYHARASALVTKDKQLLAMKRRAAKFGVNIMGMIDANAALTEVPSSTRA